MSSNLAIQLNDNTFAILSEQALAAGKTPEELAASVVESVYAGSRSNVVDAATARTEFQRCFGAIDLGHPVGVENEAIDADLARQYGATTGST